MYLSFSPLLFILYSPSVHKEKNPQEILLFMGTVKVSYKVCMQKDFYY